MNVEAAIWQESESRVDLKTALRGSHSPVFAATGVSSDIRRMDEAVDSYTTCADAASWGEELAFPLCSTSTNLARVPQASDTASGWGR